MTHKDSMLALNIGTTAAVRIDRDSDWLDVLEDASTFADTGISTLHTATSALANGLISEDQAVSTMYAALNSLRLSKSLLDASVSQILLSGRVSSESDECTESESDRGHYLHLPERA